MDRRRANIVIALVAVIALVTAVGYLRDGKGVWQYTVSEPREELHRVVDAAQVWVARPVVRGGGGGSFDSLDFRQIGLTGETGALEWRGKAGSYRIKERSHDRFVLEVSDLSGKVVRQDTLQFDTFPSAE